MDYTPDKKVAAIKEFCPDVDEERLKEVKEFLDGYCEVLYRISTRLENEAREQQKLEPENSSKMPDPESRFDSPRTPSKIPHDAQET